MQRLVKTQDGSTTSVLETHPPWRIRPCSSTLSPSVVGTSPVTSRCSLSINRRVGGKTSSAGTRSCP